MKITLCGESALAILRSIRSGLTSGIPRNPACLPRCDLISPRLEGACRWTPKRIDLARYGGVPRASKCSPVRVAVADSGDRIRAGFVCNTVYQRPLPKDAFLDLGDGVAISSPELVFLEMSKVMSPATHALLGFELCGTFSRDPANPRLGDACFGIVPATSVERIRDFLDRCGEGRNASAARETLAVIADNAWSPMEAVLATIIALPLTSYGYGMGPVVLNERIDMRETLGYAATRDTRVPDIRVVSTTVGLNYDGHEHLDLDKLAELAQDGRGDDKEGCGLEETKHAIREKVYDDLVRNRELSAAGMMILPATSEDLFRAGATDRLMASLAVAIEQKDGLDMSQVITAIASPLLARRRQLMVWSLLPWEQGVQSAHELEELERRSVSRSRLGKVVTVRVCAGGDGFIFEE